jgi:hypothetical protein
MPNKKWWDDQPTLIADSVPPDVPKDFAKREVAFCKHIGADALLLFLEKTWIGEYFYPSKYVPVYAPLGKRDLLKEVVTECRKHGLRFVAGFGGLHTQKGLVQSPDWFARSFEEARTTPEETGAYLCLNSPHREVLKGIVREAIELYEVDGIYFDGIIYPPVFCFCPNCRKKYKQMFGKEMPIRRKDKNRLKLGQETVIDFSRDIRRIIDELNPEVCYGLDCHGTMIGHCDGGQQLHLTSDLVDARILECYPTIVREQSYYAHIENRAIEVETGKPVWWPKWIARNPDANVTSNPPADLRLWGASVIAEKSSPLIVMQRTQDFDTQSVKPLKEIASLARKLRPTLREADTVAPVALFHSLESRLQRLSAKMPEHRKHFEGWYLALKNHHVLFDVIGERDMEAGKLAKYPALILPNTRYMSDTTVEHVRHFVEGGGSLIATGYSSFSDERGRDRKDFPLSDIFGARFLCDSADSLGIDFAMVTNAPVQTRLDSSDLPKRVRSGYYKSFCRHPISKGLDETLWSFIYPKHRPKFPVVKLARGAKAIFKALCYDSSLTNPLDALYAAASGKPAETLLAARESPYRVVYMPGPLDGAYWDYGWPELAEIMRNSVRWALRGRDPLQTDAQENIWMVLHHNQKKSNWVLHLQNQGVNNQYAIGFDCARTQEKSETVKKRNCPVRTCFRTAPFSITLKAIKARKLTAKSLTGKKLSLEKTGKGWLLKHPGMSEYDVVMLRETG